MKTKLIVWIVGLAAFAAGFALRFFYLDGGTTLIALCALLVFAFLSGALLIACEKGKYQGHSSFVFLASMLSLIGFCVGAT